MAGSRIQIAPSILSADFSDLRTALKLCERGKADMIHLDVMDGNFVPNITIGPPVIKSLRSHTDLFFDVHIMICDPLFWIDQFADAGADCITFHVEAAGRPTEVIEHIKSFGIQAGITLRPGTNLELVEPYIEQVDLVLLMSVEPGFGGQSFIPESLERLRQIRGFIDRNDLAEQVAIEIDGGINLENAATVAQAGADILVAGSALFKTPDPVKTMQKFHEVLR